ncbi:BTAD domain-containing putative transcriptional regulator [Anaeromicropila populeti]|uniref:Transcriptional regulatory protein, C terminal n=1 Tax=Anaeromicropila populeti TaxID=37658 RepID=A0A1I6HHZ3_9FIRM|nr:BTAD domain-containing putative transcriptional regulator [Anaeromicropila populeti]SFR54081.1 Transcriptional regulatory protein, C terminal [Anaeromicropila populeti]
MKQQNFILRENMLKVLADVKEPCILINANAGYGKTVLALQYCKTREIMDVWYTFIKADNRKKVFMKNLVDAWKKKCLDLDFEVTEEENYEWYIKRMLEKLNENLEGKQLRLVFDDFHLIDNSEIHNLMKYLITNIPQNAKVLILGRSSMADGLSKLIMEGFCYCVAQESLAFSLEETDSFVKLFSDYKDKKQMGKILFEKFNGWQAGIKAALIYFENQKPINYEKINWEELISISLLTQYIEEEIYNYLPEEIRHFLKITAVLDEFNLELCNYIFLNQESERLISILLRENLFIEKVGEDCNTWYYNTIFRTFLCNQLLPKEKEEIIKKASYYCCSIGKYEMAIDYAMRIHDVQHLKKVLALYQSDLVQHLDDGLVKKCILYFLNVGNCLGSDILEQIGEYFIYRNKMKKSEYDLSRDSFIPTNQECSYQDFYKLLIRYNENQPYYSKKIKDALFGSVQNVEKADNPAVNKKIIVKSFGRFEVIFSEDEKEIPWRTKKGCELFAYLHELQGKPVSRQKILEKLWNHYVPDNAVAMLHNMLYNIRKELAAHHLDNLIQYKNKMYSLNMEYIQSDLSEMILFCERIQKNDMAALRKNQDYFLVYPGTYLGDFDCEWGREGKEYYETMYIKGCVLLAQEYIKEKSYENSIAFLKKALEIDSYSEKIVGMLIFCYGQLGNYKLVRKKYEDFCILLKKELEIEPSDKLNEIYRHSFIEENIKNERVYV